MSVLLLSGGIDSLVLLAQECAAERYPLCLSFRYGQKHVRELEAAASISKHYGVPHHTHTLPAEVFTGSTLTRGSGNRQGPDTVVAGRNGVFISIAAAVAVGRGHRDILLGAHAGDAAIYPDCRRGFVTAISEALKLACGVEVEAPFVNYSKREIVALGKSLQAPLHLAWSCYEGGSEPCRECGACTARREAGV